MNSVFVLHFTGSPEEPNARIIGVYSSYAQASNAEDNELERADKQDIGPYRPYLEITEQEIVPHINTLDQTEIQLSVGNLGLGYREANRHITGGFTPEYFEVILKEMTDEIFRPTLPPVQ